MRRKCSYHDYVAAHQARFRQAWFIWQKAERDRPAVRRRPRDSREVGLLDRLAQDRWDAALASGKLERVAPRRFRLHVDRPS
ncbi:MAG: hypothetical protein ACOX4G_11115 [Limnochordia bacterium]|jgi:hypothetical protein